MITYKNGDTYDGEWFKNCEHGYGTYKFNNSKNVYKGNFILGKMCDNNAKMTWYD